VRRFQWRCQPIAVTRLLANPVSPLPEVDNPRRIGHRQEVENVRPLPRRANRLVMTECSPRFTATYGSSARASVEVPRASTRGVVGPAWRTRRPRILRRPTPQGRVLDAKAATTLATRKCGQQRTGASGWDSARDRYSGLSSRVRLVRRCSVSGCAYLLRASSDDQAQMPAPLPLARPRCASVG